MSVRKKAETASVAKRKAARKANQSVYTEAEKKFVRIKVAVGLTDKDQPCLVTAPGYSKKQIAALLSKISVALGKEIFEEEKAKEPKKSPLILPEQPGKIVGIKKPKIYTK